MIIRDGADRKRFFDNSTGFVRCMKTLHDAFGMDKERGVTTVTKHLEALLGIHGEDWELFRLYTVWSTELLCNLLWEGVDVDRTAVSVDAVAKKAADHLSGLILYDSAKSFFRRMGTEKGVDCHAMGRAMFTDPKDN